MRSYLYILPLAVLIGLGIGCRLENVRPDNDKDIVIDDPTEEELTDCEAMCKKIGPDGLNCEEGQSVYDSAVEGPRGEPNVSCTDFCAGQQANGLDTNASCIARVRSCEDIEPIHNQGCE